MIVLVISSCSLPGAFNWTDPVNLGRYINTLSDDQDISVNANGTIGYTVKYDQPGAPGDYDIYQFVMPEIARPDQTIKLYGNVLNEVDSAAAVNHERNHQPSH